MGDKEDRLLSVIIPVYNGSKRIERCMKSVFAQTYSKLEIIVIDDGSQDDSYDVLARAVQQQGQSNFPVRIIRQDNCGVANTRNRGIEMANGDYIAFVDQDDYIDRLYCEELMALANKEGYDIVIGGYCRVTEDGKIIKIVQPQDTPWSKFSIVAPWGRVYRRRFIIENNISFLTTGIGEDVYMNINAYARTHAISYIENHKYMWVNNLESVSNQSQRSISEKTNPIYMLNATYAALPAQRVFDYELEEYFMTRYITWYLLYSAGGSSADNIHKVYHQLFSWLKDKYPTYRNNKYISPFRPKGELFFNRVCVYIFISLERMGLAEGVLKIVAKREKDGQ